MTPASGAPPAAGRNSLLLAIETAGSCCSAALACDGAMLAAERRTLRHGHAEALLPMIDRVMAQAALPPSQIGIVAVATGPGGFTGIRAGLAAAHGIALAAGARLVGVSSFATVAAGVALAERHRDGAALLVALDSRRADLYVQLIAADGMTPLAAPQALLPDRLADYVARAMPDGALLIAGDMAEAAADALAARPATAVLDRSAPDALGVAAAVRRQLAAAVPIDPARPLYLRPPDVTPPPHRPHRAAR